MYMLWRSNNLLHPERIYDILLLLGYLSDLVPPDPIPNSEVKRVSVDDTITQSVEGTIDRSQAFFLAKIGLSDILQYADKRVSS